MTYFQPENQPLPPPPNGGWVSDELYEDAHGNFGIAYTDVVLRDPETNALFLPIRGVEPEKGSVWFIGGRQNFGESREESAARHVKHDTGLVMADGRFIDTSYFDIAHVTPRDGKKPAVRQAANTVLIADLKPDEVQDLNRVVADGKLTKEYAGGNWFNPDTDSSKELPAPVRQFMRDYFGRQVMLGALYGLAKEEDARRFPNRWQKLKQLAATALHGANGK